MQKRKIKNQKGITLVALVITIIVMLILVGVTVTVALNGGLFSTASDATTKTETEKQKELELENERIKVGDTWYDSIEDYRAEIPSEDQTEIGEEAAVVYPITVNTYYCDYYSEEDEIPTTISQNGTVTFYFYPTVSLAGGWNYVVRGASYTIEELDDRTLQINLYNPTGPVNVTVTGPD